MLILGQQETEHKDCKITMHGASVCGESQKKRLPKNSNPNICKANHGTVLGKCSQNAIGLRNNTRSRARKNGISTSGDREFTGKFPCSKCAFVAARAISLARHECRLHGHCKTSASASISKLSSKQVQRETKTACYSQVSFHRNITRQKRKETNDTLSLKDVRGLHGHYKSKASGNNSKISSKQAQQETKKLSQVSLHRNIARQKRKKISETNDTLSLKYDKHSQENRDMNSVSHDDNSNVSQTELQLDHQSNETGTSSSLNDCAEVVSANQDIKCEICGKRFWRRFSLAEHMKHHQRNSHADRDRIECRDGRKKLVCKQCGFEAVHSYIFGRHLKRMHGKQSCQLKSECGQHNSNEDASKAEVSCSAVAVAPMNVTEADNIITDVSDKSNGSNNSVKEGEPLKSNEIESLSYSSSLQIQQKCAAKEDIMSAQRVVDEAEDVRTTVDCELNQSLLHERQTCGKRLNTSERVSSHTLTHTAVTFAKSGTTVGENQSSFNCSGCTFVASDQNTLFRHLRDKHTWFELQNASKVKSTYCCCKCDYMSARRYTVIRHLRNLHGLSDLEIVLGSETTVHTDSEEKLTDENVDETERELEERSAVKNLEVYECSSGNKDVTSDKSTYDLQRNQTVLSQVQSDCHQNTENLNDAQCSLRRNLESKDELSTPDMLQEYTKLLPKNRMYKCKICKREFRQLRGLVHHMSVHCGKKQLIDGELKYCCKKCEFTSDHSFYLARHVIEMHDWNDLSSDFHDELFGREFLVDNSADPLPHLPSRSVSDSKPIHELMDVTENWNMCKLCGKKMTTVTSLQRHIRETHWGIRGRNKVKNFKQHDRKKCPHCSVVRKSDQTLRRHMKVHDDEQPVFQCGDCGRCFKTVYTLRKHTEIHTDMRSFICETCGRAFRTFNQLAVHELIHTGEKPHCCDECGMRFRQIPALLVHKRRHSGEKPYPCDQCSKTFRTCHQLKDHVIVMHTELKPFSCPCCDLKFGLRKAMRRHIKVRHGAEYLRDT